MTAYVSSKCASTVVTRSNNGVVSVTGSVTTTASIATGDTFQMVKVPAGATILDVKAGWSASPGTTVPLSVGDGGSASRFINAFATGGAATVATQNSGGGGGVGYTYTAEDTIDVTLGTVTSGAAAGPVLTLTVVYTTDL